MNFWAKLHRGKHHCELTSFATTGSIVALIVSFYIYFFMNQRFGDNMLYLFGLTTLAGSLGLIFYRYSMRKYPFNKI